MADARALCADYERWLREHIPVDDRELKRKHGEMAAAELRFLRGTYFRGWSASLSALSNFGEFPTQSGLEKGRKGSKIRKYFSRRGGGR